MRLAALSDVQTGHDFESGDDGTAVTLRNLHVFETFPVDSESDQSLPLFPIGFDVNIRSILAVGIGNDLVGQPDDGAVVFVKPSGASRFLHGLGLSLGDQFAENI